MTSHAHFLCHVTTLKDGEARSFILDASGTRHDILVVNRNGVLRAFANACPHQHTPLEIFPGKFFDAAGDYLVCSTHGARFEPANGLCVSGPCIGQSLKAITLIERDGALFALLPSRG